jgi:hypothetical protein
LEQYREEKLAKEMAILEAKRLEEEMKVREIEE